MPLMCDRFVFIEKRCVFDRFVLPDTPSKHPYRAHWRSPLPPRNSRDTLRVTSQKNKGHTEFYRSKVSGHTTYWSHLGGTHRGSHRNFFRSHPKIYRSHPENLLVTGHTFPVTGPTITRHRANITGHTPQISGDTPQNAGHHAPKNLSHATNLRPNHPNYLSHGTTIEGQRQQQ